MEHKDSDKNEIIQPLSKPQNNIENYLNEAISCYKLGRYQDAILFCEKVIHIDMNCSRAYLGKALALVRLKQYQEAILACQKGIGLKPKNAKAYIILGEVLFILELYSESGSAYRQASRIRKNYKNFYEKKLNQLTNKGAYFYNEKMYEKADIIYTHLLLFDPTNALAKEQLKNLNNFKLLAQGDDFFMRGMYQEAASIYHQLMQIDSKYISLYFSKINLLLEEGHQLKTLEDNDKALIIYENALLFASTSSYGNVYIKSIKPNLCKLKGEFFFNNKQYLEASIAYKEAIQFDHSIKSITKAKAHFLLIEGEKLIEMKELEKALNILNDALLFDTTITAIHHHLANIYLKLNQYEQAGISYKNAVQLEPNIQVEYQAQGMMLFEPSIKLFISKNYKEAIAAFKNVKSFSSKNPPLLALQGKALLNEGQKLFNVKLYQDAIIAYDNALFFIMGMNTNDKSSLLEEVLFAKGETFFEMHQYRKAYRIFKNLHPQNSNKIWAFYISFFNKAESLFEEACYRQAGIAYRIAILFNLNSEDIERYKDQGRALLMQSFTLYENRKYEQAFHLYRQAVQFDRDNLNTNAVRGISIKELVIFAKSKEVINTIGEQEVNINIDDLEMQQSYKELPSQAFPNKGRVHYYRGGKE